MLETGLVEEARQISRIYGGTARQAIGYKELQPYLDGADSLESCIDRLKQATRNYFYTYYIIRYHFCESHFLPDQPVHPDFRIDLLATILGSQ